MQQIHCTLHPYMPKCQCEYCTREHSQICTYIYGTFHNSFSTKCINEPRITLRYLLQCRWHRRQAPRIYACRPSTVQHTHVSVGMWIIHFYQYFATPNNSNLLRMHIYVMYVHLAAGYAHADWTYQIWAPHWMTLDLVRCFLVCCWTNSVLHMRTQIDASQHELFSQIRSTINTKCWKREDEYGQTQRFGRAKMCAINGFHQIVCCSTNWKGNVCVCVCAMHDASWRFSLSLCVYWLMIHLYLSMRFAPSILSIYSISFGTSAVDVLSQ